MKFAALKFEHPKECRRPQARVLQRPMGTNLKLTCLWNPDSWALESRIQLKESGIPQTIRIQNPSFTEKH